MFIFSLFTRNYSSLLLAISFELLVLLLLLLFVINNNKLRHNVSIINLFYVVSTILTFPARNLFIE